jgi:hypothetical protein
MPPSSKGTIVITAKCLGTLSLSAVDATRSGNE